MAHGPFFFTIKLADVPSRAEEKTLHLAVRYSVAGREIWTITVVETTTSKSCARRCRRLTRRQFLRNLRCLLMRMISRICGTNSSRRSSLAARPRQSVVFSPSTRVTDGDCRLRHQALLVEIRHRALNQRVPLQRDMILPHSCVHPGVQPRSPRRLLTREQTLTPRRVRTQCHSRRLHVLQVVFPATKLKSYCCLLTMIQTVITTRMARSPWCLPCAGVSRAVIRVTIFNSEEEP